jgi:magnesium chelatase subunit D
VIPRYPFTALVGQNNMKLALLLNAVNPRLGGVLVRGQKGTAKSTAVRGLAALLPPIQVVEGCQFQCAPGESSSRCPDCVERNLPTTSRVQRAELVELPIGATEDRVIGSLDIERTLSTGQRHFEPGLLARANRGILYVDEVNLLPDHLVDTLLDAAAMGVNSVERDGVSFSHPASFVLVGTMNPEEGDLRPQLLDRFALAIDVEGMPSTVQRVEVVRRRIAFETDPVRFVEHWQSEEDAERARIANARQVLPSVQVEDALVELIARICTAFEVDGLRADIVIYRTAATLAAYAGRLMVTADDIRQAAELALPHRRRRQPFDQPGLDHDRLNSLIDDFGNDAEPVEPPPPPPDGPDRNGGTEAPPRVFEVGAAPDVPLPPVFQTPRAGGAERTSRSRARLAEGSRGRHVRSTHRRIGAVDVLATLRGAATYQRAVPNAADLRYKVRAAPLGTLTVFVVDASGSMAARRRMAVAKGAVMRLLLRAYQTRDEVALIGFRGNSAEVVLPPTDSVDFASTRLRQMPTGGRTPLAHALNRAGALLAQHRRAAQRVVVVSDGRANVPFETADAFRDALTQARLLRSSSAHIAVVDTEDGPIRLGRAAHLARELDADYVRLDTTS